MINTQFERYPDGFYFFNQKELGKNYDELNNAFSKHFANFSIAYSFKTNYTPSLCNLLRLKGAIAEVVSGMELQLALDLGFPGNKIIYNGPFKSESSLKTAIFNDVNIHIDSFDELKVITKILESDSSDITVNLGLRTNFSIENENRSRFGVDVNSDEFIAILELVKDSSRINLRGLHCHHPFRDLNTFAERIEKLISISDKIEVDFEYLDIGGGFYSRMPAELAIFFNISLPSYDDYSDIIYKSFQKKWTKSTIPKLIIEPGSALVANVFEFYCRVVSIKKIGGKNIATLSGSKFNILPNSKKNINLPIEVYPSKISNVHQQEDVYNLCGYTCIENDILYENYKGLLNVGDIIAFKNVGSYSIVMKPPFILPNYAILTLDKYGKFIEIKSEETYEYIFQNFNL
jgi:diaminopimelate decarboxylase